MTMHKLSATMQIAATASVLSQNAKANEQKSADQSRQTIRKPLARYLEAIVR